MPHYPKPYFRPARGVWYVQINGRETTLGRDKAAAFQKYHLLMAGTPEPITVPINLEIAASMPNREMAPPPTTAPAVAPTPTSTLVVVLIDEFLEWSKANQAADTYRWYKDRLNSFCKSIPPRLTVAQLKPFHVQKWVDSYSSNIASGTRRNLIASVKRVMSWAEEQGYIERSPVAKMKKPACGRKEQIVTQEQYEALLAWSSDQAFKDLLMVTWETGCRPQESLIVEAQHVDQQNARWVFPTADSKGHRKPRVVYLTPRALEICTRLVQEHPTGPIFRNSEGQPWTPWSTNCRFRRAQKKLGVKVSLYALRHTWINRGLTNGVDAFTVALLAGHSDPSMLAKHYQHLAQAPGYLAEQARKAAN